MSHKIKLSLIFISLATATTLVPSAHEQKSGRYKSQMYYGGYEYPEAAQPIHETNPKRRALKKKKKAPTEFETRRHDYGPHGEGESGAPA